MQLRERIARAPAGPGVYRWLDASGAVLYVGKAKNLRTRLKSYFQEKRKNLGGPWKASLLAHLADISWTVTNSELEALVLETNLIKELRPKYNVLMKDDKNYVYVRISIQDPYPSVEIVRRFTSDGAKVFGPFLSSHAVQRTLDILQEILHYRACKQSWKVRNRKPCLEYQIGQCCGLCIGAVTDEEYRSRIAAVLSFFKGDRRPVIDRTKSLMEQAASDRQFERAAKCRDALEALAEVSERQRVSDPSGGDCDVWGTASLSSGKALVVLLQQRGGNVVNECHFALRGEAESAADILEQFLPQYYGEGTDVPDTIVLGTTFPGLETFAAWASAKRKRKVDVLVPERGAKSHLLHLAERNVREKVSQLEAKWEADARKTSEALADLQQILNLPARPRRIEGYDISHLSGTETVGSMVVALHGKLLNEHYRSFTIRTMLRGEVDDTRALREVLTRRLRHLMGGSAGEEKRWKGEGITFGKALKKEQNVIAESLRKHPKRLTQEEINVRQFLVARKKDHIVGFVRLHEMKSGCMELKSLWVSGGERGAKLGQFLVRKILQRLNKGKVYVTTDPHLEQYYAEVGFRYVMKPPRELQERLENKQKEWPDHAPGLVMVYDTAQHKPDPSLESHPDLLVIDGGKGQLSAVCEVLRESDLEIPVVSLAKREEHVFLPGQPEPVTFLPDAEGKFLLMRLRDEAHRFANRHREARAKTALLHGR